MDQIKIALGYSPRQWGDIQALDARFQQDGRFSVVTAATGAQQLFDDAIAFDADVVILSPLCPGYQAQVIADLLHHESKPIPTIGLIPAMRESDADEMYAAGMKAHAGLPLDDIQINRVIAQIPEVVSQALAERRADTFVPVTRQELTTVLDSGWRARTIAVWSPKGGVGKTFASVNLAVALGVVGLRKTLLIDADVSRANVHVYLRLPVDRNLFALYSQVVGRVARTGGKPEVTQHILKQNITHYGGATGSKLDVLVGIPKMHMGGTEEFRGDDERTADIMAQIIRAASREYDFRILDLGPDLNQPSHWAALAEADLVLVIVTAELTCINDLKNALPSLKQTFGGLERFQVVINKFDNEYGIPQADILREIEMGKFGFIPADDKKATLSINMQTPLVLDKPGALSDGVMSVAAHLYPPLEIVWEKRGGKIGGEYRRSTQRQKGEGLGGKIINLLATNGG